MRFELKLVDIELHNFRLFDKIKINFDDKLTVLIGENGAGKTALLEGVAKALNVFTENMKTATTNVDFKSIYQDTDIRYDAKELETNIEVAFNEIEKLLPEEGSVQAFTSKMRQAVSELDIKKLIADIDYKIEELNDKYRKADSDDDAENIVEKINNLQILRAEIESEEIESEKVKIEEITWQPLTWQINKNRSNTQIKKFTEATKLSDLANDVHEANRRKEELSLPIVVYYSTERISANAKNGFDDSNEDIEVFNTYDDALNGKSLNFKWFLEWFIWKEDNIKTSQTVLDAVKKAIFSILNDENESSFKDIYTDRSRKKDYRLIIEKDEDKVEVNQLSSGEKSLFVLVSDLARRLALANPLSKNPLSEGQGIVLIDEIDLHLHPRWQRKVVPKLIEIFPKIQWVITTHSPFVISSEGITPHNAYLLTKDAETDKTIIVSIEDLGKQTEGLEPNRILKEIMTVPLRNEETEKDIEELTRLLNENDFDKPKAQDLFKGLLEKLGNHDAFIVRATHRISVLERQKQVAV